MADGSLTRERHELSLVQDAQSVHFSQGVHLLLIRATRGGKERERERNRVDAVRAGANGSPVRACGPEPNGHGSTFRGKVTAITVSGRGQACSTKSSAMIWPKMEPRCTALHCNAKIMLHPESEQPARRWYEWHDNTTAGARSYRWCASVGKSAAEGVEIVGNQVMCQKKKAA